MGNSSSQNQNIEGPYVRSTRQFTGQRQEEQANEYPTLLIEPEHLKFFADGDIGKVRSLLEQGYDPSSRNNQPLSFALRHNQQEIIRLLLQEDKVKEKLSKLSDSDKEKLKSLNIEYGFRSKKKSARKTKKSARKTKKSARKTKKSARKNRK